MTGPVTPVCSSRTDSIDLQFELVALRQPIDGPIKIENGTRPCPSASS